MFTNGKAPETKAKCSIVRKKYGEHYYQSAVRSLIYLMIESRYDSCYATTMLAKFCNDPGEVHYEALLWVMGSCMHVKFLHITTLMVI